MTTETRERVSMMVIKLSLGAGGSFLSAAFALGALLYGGFLIAAAISTFIMIAIVSYLFARIKLPVFALSTLVWLVILALLRGWGL